MTSRHSATPSEGEVYSSDSEKAHKSLPNRNSTTVDRRIRDYASTSRSRSRSPYRASRGEKRRYHERSRDRDPRQFRVRYEDGYDSSSRHRRDGSYEDLDPGHTSRNYLRYDDEDDRRARHKRQRTRSRSRSPYRHGRREGPSKSYHHDRSGHKDRRLGSGRDARDSVDSSRSHREQSVSERGQSPSVAPVSKNHTETRDSQAARSTTTTNDTSGMSREYVSGVGMVDQANTFDRNGKAQAETNTSTSLAEPLDEAAIIEERRKRREAIRAKYRTQPTPLLVQALQQGSEAASPTSTANATKASSVEPGQSNNFTRNDHFTNQSSDSPQQFSPKTPKEPSGPQSPADFDFSKAENLANPDNTVTEGADEEPSAADYDPTIDMQEERARHDQSMFHEDNSSISQDVAQINGQQPQVEEQSQPPAQKKKDELDMFAEEHELGDDDDMFALGPTKQEATAKGPAQALDVTMMDNWDDPGGYYITIAGELIASRYAVMHSLGRGMFASVIRAKDTETDTLVAIKIIRNNDTMRKAGLKELSILETLAAADPNDTKHVVRLLRSFDHKGHLCLVFENLSLNLRELLKKFGRDVGLNIKAIRSYAQQLFLGLSLLKKCGILHADLKPDNVLCSENHSHIKICDLGSASPLNENEIAPYLVSRFYRAPEIMLGIEYDTGIDVWSIGCTLFELYTGKILFTGRNNNGMLKAIMECRGKFPHKLLRRGSLTFDHFDDLLNFHAREEDRLSGRTVTKIMDFKKPTRDLRSRIIPKGKKMDDTERKEIELFLDLLDKCLDLRPEKRITPGDALRHPFIMRGNIK